MFLYIFRCYRKYCSDGYNFFYICRTRTNCNKKIADWKLRVSVVVCFFQIFDYFFVLQLLIVVSNINIFCRDETLSVTLWDKFAIDFNDNQHQEKVDGPAIVVFASMSVRTYRGNIEYLLILKFLVYMLLTLSTTKYVIVCNYRSALYINMFSIKNLQQFGNTRSYGFSQ